MLFLQGVGGQGGPMALGFHVQVGARFLKEPAPYLIRGDFSARGGPAQCKPFQDLGRVCRGVGEEEGLGVEGALVLQSRLRRSFLKTCPVMTLHGPGLMPPSPS